MREASHTTLPADNAETRRRHTRVSFILKIIMTVLLQSFITALAPAHAGKYDTDAWDGKFRYGAYSTLVSSHILGREFHAIISTANNPNVDLQELAEYIAKFKARYDNLTDKEIDAIIKYAREDSTPSIYEEERSIVNNTDQNDAFIAMMHARKDLAPIGHLIQNDIFVSDNFQFSTHRALYNNAYDIAQNSVAAIINAYVAGIRSVEFDVLESKDYANFVIHDLVTNRLDGSFDFPPKYVDDYNFSDIINTPENVIVPFKNKILIEETGIKHLVSTEHVLNIVCNLMPELTLYADARNDAPISLIRLFATTFKGWQSCRNQVVIKIYPFQLNGGLTDLINRYAERYHGGDAYTAIREIAEVNPHVLLAIGNAEAESNEDVMMTGITDFDWDAFQEEAPFLPFSRHAPESQNSFQGASIFTAEQLTDIEVKTFKMFRWTMGFAGITNPLVLQMAAIPSLTQIIKDGNSADYNAMDSDDRIKAAAHDNFLALYKRVKYGDLVLQNHILEAETVDLAAKIAHIRFGMSDRYPDFAFARRFEGTDIVDQRTLNNFNYNMLGTVYQPSDFGTIKVRSTAAMVRRAEELTAITGTPTVYATTDLPTDLRMAFMGLLGNEELDLPADIIHRPSSIIKEEYAIDPATFVPPAWSTRLSGTLHENYSGTFPNDYKAINDMVGNLAKQKKILRSLERAYVFDLPLLNRDAFKLLGFLSVPLSSEIDKDELKDMISKHEATIIHLEAEVIEAKVIFQEKYKVKFVGERSFIEY